MKHGRSYSAKRTALWKTSLQHKKLFSSMPSMLDTRLVSGQQVTKFSSMPHLQRDTVGPGILKQRLGYLCGAGFPWQQRLAVNLLDVDAKVMGGVGQGAAAKKPAGSALNSVAANVKSS